MGFLVRHNLLFQVLLTALLIALLVWRTDVAAVLRKVGGADVRWVLVAVGMITVSRLTQAYRWRLFLGHRQRLPLVPLTGIYLVATLANTLVPLRTGDVLRVQIASQRFHLPRAELAATVFVVESVLDWFAGLLVFIAGLIVVNPSIVPPSVVALLGVLVAAALIGVIALARMDRSRDFSVVPPIRWLPQRMRPAAAEHSRRFLEGLAALRDSGRAAPAVAVALVVILLEVVVYWCLGRAFGLELSFAEYIILMAGANIILALPLTPWSIGSFEIAVIEVAGLLGADRVAAGSYAVGAHLVLMIWLNAMGLLAVWMLGLNLRDLLGARPDRHNGAQKPAERAGN